MNNRPIKFRVWHKGRNEWVHPPGQEPNILGESILLGGFCQVPLEELNDLEVLQFTGLKDSAGKEIYEGDICDVGIVTRTIDYGIGGFYLASNPLIEYLPANTDALSLDFNPSWIDVKIIGNVWENPNFFERKDS